MKNKIFYIKSYSKGQFTLPKEVREEFNLGDDFWLELTVDGNKMIVKKAEPMDRVREPVTSDYVTKIQKINGSWSLQEDWEKIRQDFDSRGNKSDW